MTKQFKVGDKVRVLDASKIMFGSTWYKNSGEYEVTFVYPRGHIRTDTKLSYGLEGMISRDEFDAIELITPKSKKPNRMAELESRIAELERQLAEVMSPFGSDFQPFIKKERLTPNQQRKAAIDNAKDFVAATLNEYQLSEGEVSYVVDEGNSFVSVILTHLFSGKTLAKGIAKCAPDDVFNADIGKAIALGRALGLDVSEFENAPKPTELVVGHVITEVNGPCGLGRIYKVENGKAYNDGPGSWWRTDLSSNNTLTGLDDTEAKY